MKWFKGSNTKRGDTAEAEVPYTPPPKDSQAKADEPEVPTDPKLKDIAQWRDRGDSEAVKQLLTMLIAESAPNYRVEIVKALKSCPSEDVLASLVFAMRLDDRHARMAAAEAVGIFGDARATEHLYMAITDRDPGVRAKAAESLGKLGDRGALKLLTQALGDRAASVRISAAEALGRIGDPSVVNSLINAMMQANTIARAPMADALGKLGDERAVGTLVESLDDKAWDIHWASAAALARIGGVNAIGALLTWSKRIFASGVKQISAAEKCQLVNEVMLELFRGLQTTDMQDVTPKVDSRIVMRSWELLDAANATEGWVEEVIDNPVWFILSDEFARRRVPPLHQPRATEPVIETHESNGGEMAEVAPDTTLNDTEDDSGTDDPFNSDDVPLEELSVEIEVAPMTNGYHHAEEPIPAAPEITGVAADFLTFIADAGLHDIVLVGESVCDLARGEVPGILNITCLIHEHDGAIPSSEDPIVWNAAWDAKVQPILDRLVVVLNSNLTDLVNGKVQFTSGEQSLRVRYVGPYLIQDRRFTWRDSQVECKSNQVVSRSAMIAIASLRQVYGLVSMAPVDRMWVDANQQWGGELARGLRNTESKLLDVDQPRPELGLVDVLRVLLLKHRFGFTLTDQTVDVLEHASNVIRENPDAARMQFSKKAFDRLANAAPYEVIVEEFRMLDLHSVLMDVLDAGNLQKLNEILMRKEADRTRMLADAQRNVEEARRVLDEKQKSFDEKRAEFTKSLSQMDGPQATRIDIEERLRSRIDRLKAADETARGAAARLSEITQQLQAVTAENKVDRALLQSHREALAAKREHDAELADLKKEVESLRSAMDKKQESTMASEGRAEKLGEELEAATQAFDEAQAASEAADAALAEIQASLALTPERRREILKAVPATA